jgi:hypothetical protein
MTGRLSPAEEKFQLFSYKEKYLKGKFARITRGIFPLSNRGKLELYGL